MEKLFYSTDIDLNVIELDTEADVENYLKENTNILDYCIGSKTNSGWQVKAEYVENGIAKSDDQQKINRSQTWKFHL